MEKERKLKLDSQGCVIVLPPSDEVIIKMSKDEAAKILRCLSRTSARNNYADLSGVLDTCEKIEKQLYEKIYKK